MEGSPTSHPMLIGRERSIPVVIGCPDAIDRLAPFDGAHCTLDGLAKCLYRGEMELKPEEILLMLLPSRIKNQMRLKGVGARHFEPVNRCGSRLGRRSLQTIVRVLPGFLNDMNPMFEAKFLSLDTVDLSNQMVVRQARHTTLVAGHQL